MREIKIPDLLFADIVNLCEMLKTDPESFITEQLQKSILPYGTHDDQYNFLIKGEKGLYTPNDLYGNSMNGEAKPCWIVEPTSMFGAPYYKIIVAGKIMKVPAKCITK